MKVRRDVFRPSYPTPAAMITCATPDGRPNIITLGEVYMLSLEPLVMGISIRPQRYSYGVIAETREFVVNYVTEELAAQTDYCGMVSGRDVDKFAATGLTPEPAAEVQAPLIAECPLNIECRVRDILPLGSHHVFVADAVATHVEEAILDANGQVDPERARAIAFIGRAYWKVEGLVDRAFVPGRRFRPAGR
ncbi:MAG TPA: flavin reductase family protein [Chloroflexi bacterium]|jgi:flavin reductase (DIM6/NTAB) family NADH-FMN oxidoreductase RutF|nr:flavin reductase family protein [Chloroflexota bacterium]